MHTVIHSCLAQKPSTYKDAGTGIEFTTWNIPSEEKSGGLTFGMALPGNALEKDATEFIGYIVRHPPVQRNIQVPDSEARTTLPMTSPPAKAGAE